MTEIVGRADGSSPSVATQQGWLGVARTDEPIPLSTLAVNTRLEVVGRLKRMSGLHARHAVGWDCDQDIGPHALIFFYAEPPDEDEPHRVELRTAGRWFIDGDDVQNLPLMLNQLGDVAEGFLDAGDLDPRMHMVDPQRVERMSGRARYVGVGVTSLDMPQARFRDIRERVAGNPFAVPRRAFAHLTDGTQVLFSRSLAPGADRPTRARIGVFSENVMSNRPLDLFQGRPGLVWSRLRAGDQDQPVGVWRELQRLHDLLLAGEQRRHHRRRR